jgi:iron complex transport system substrate-binding protein
MRICSFLPSATETLYALGLGDDVAGVTFECDYPAEARQKAVVVHTNLPLGLRAPEIDSAVNDFVRRGESLYQVDLPELARIDPDLIITQDLCHVCAASPDDLGAALGQLPHAPQVLTLSPKTLEEVWQGIRRVGDATGHAEKSARIVEELKARVSRVQAAINQAKLKRTLCLEWLDPPFIAGHWVPEMVACSGGIDVLGRAGEPGFRSDWDSVLSSNAEAVVLMPCGYNLRQTIDEFRSMRLPEAWERLPAVEKGRVFAVHASAYFSRPGPRLVEGIEILTHVLHPELAPVGPPPHSVVCL